MIKTYKEENKIDEKQRRKKEKSNGKKNKMNIEIETVPQHPQSSDAYLLFSPECWISFGAVRFFGERRDEYFRGHAQIWIRSQGNLPHSLPRKKVETFPVLRTGLKFVT